jgi:hypothetical protein
VIRQLSISHQAILAAALLATLGLNACHHDDADGPINVHNQAAQQRFTGTPPGTVTASSSDASTAAINVHEQAAERERAPSIKPVPELLTECQKAALEAARARQPAKPCPH